MDLFELLFIAAFILFPVLEGILRQRKKGKGSGPGADRSAESGRPEAREEEVREASDMVPDDLWELMTGERRRSGEEADGGAESESPWSLAGEAGTGAGTTTGTGEESAWEPEPWMDEGAVSREPESLEYEGPEAYTLETPAPPPIERRAPTAEARHRAFHSFLDEPKPSGRQRRSPLVKALRSPDGLRQAVLLKEVLGPPKGLE